MLVEQKIRQWQRAYVDSVNFQSQKKGGFLYARVAKKLPKHYGYTYKLSQDQRCTRCRYTSTGLTSMLVFLIVGPKCTVAEWHGVPCLVTVSMPTGQTDRLTDAKLLHYAFC